MGWSKYFYQDAVKHNANKDSLLIATELEGYTQKYPASIVPEFVMS